MEMVQDIETASKISYKKATFWAKREAETFYIHWNEP